MSALLRQYFDIAFLMGRPQDLPGGERQMWIGVALAFTVSCIAAVAAGYDASRGVLLTVLELVVTGAVLRAALGLVGRPARMEQAFGGYCGAAAFVNAAAVPIYLGQGGVVGADPGFAGFVLLVWNLSLLGHVIRHTFDVRLAISILLAFAYMLVLTAAVQPVLSGSPGTVEPGAADVGTRSSRVAARAVDAVEWSRFSDADRSLARTDRVL